MAEKTVKKLKIFEEVPKIFPRGIKGTFYVRLRKGDIDKWVSTRTSDPEKAKAKAVDIAESKFEAELISRTEKNEYKRDKKISDTVIKIVAKKHKEDGIPVEKAQDKWIELSVSYTDLSDNLKSFYATICRRFAEWCSGEGIEFIEQVDAKTAVKYSKFLWKSGIGAKTYNDHFKHLSNVFSAIDADESLSYGNPFDKSKVHRKKKATEGHLPLEPVQLRAVIKAAAKDSADYRDLIVIGSQTGLRLKDASLLRWNSITGNFLEVTPFKTLWTINKKVARIPITQTMRGLLYERIKKRCGSEYVLPSIANHYQPGGNQQYVSKKCKDIFKSALNTGDVDITRKAGHHRKRQASVYSFHSLRTTFMSLLATQDVSIRDAMNILAWESSDMIRVYEKMLEAYRGDADKRTLKIVNQIAEFKMDIPEVEEKTPPPRPSPGELKKLASSMTNTAIAEKYCVSETAVRKWMKKHGIN